MKKLRSEKLRADFPFSTRGHATARFLEGFLEGFSNSKCFLEGFLEL